MSEGGEHPGRGPARPFLLCVMMLAFAWLAPALPACAASAFADWSAVVVAGDWHDHGGGSSEGFDNARRDVSAALLRAGFQAQNLRQFSVRPQRYKPAPGRSGVDAIYDGLVDVTAKAQGGCLIYFTSHGAPSGVVIGERIVPPGVIAGMLDSTCGERPTIVVISACFSGVFVPGLAKSNRMILTAARPDRTSFGCGQDDKYPYFDDCFLQSMPVAHEFAGLAEAVRMCVSRREDAVGATPPSEPQLWIGPALAPMLPLYQFSPPTTPEAAVPGL
jgi:hypothetical protein